MRRRLGLCIQRSTKQIGTTLLKDIGQRKIASAAIIGLFGMAALSGCGASQPSESQIQIAVSNCFVIEAAQLDEESAIRKCSDELGTIGDSAFVLKYPVQ